MIGTVNMYDFETLHNHYVTWGLNYVSFTFNKPKTLQIQMFESQIFTGQMSKKLEKINLIFVEYMIIENIFADLSSEKMSIDSAKRLFARS